MRVLPLILIATFISSCVGGPEPGWSIIQIIENQASMEVEIITHEYNHGNENDTLLDTLDILLHGESFIHEYTDTQPELFHSKNQVSFIFSDGKALHYYSDSFEVQGINNPFLSYNDHGYDINSSLEGDTFTYTLSEEDYNRAL